MEKEGINKENSKIELSKEFGYKDEDIETKKINKKIIFYSAGIIVLCIVLIILVLKVAFFSYFRFLYSEPVHVTLV